MNLGQLLGERELYGTDLKPEPERSGRAPIVINHVKDMDVGDSPYSPSAVIPHGRTDFVPAPAARPNHDPLKRLAGKTMREKIMAALTEAPGLTMPELADVIVVGKGPLSATIHSMFTRGDIARDGKHGTYRYKIKAAA